MKINGLGLVLILLVLLQACNTPFKTARKSYNRAEYNKAIPQFKEALADGHPAVEINRYIGEAYRRSNRIKEAEQYYKAALDANSNDDTVRFYYAHALKANGKYQEAQQRFESYSKTGKNSEFVRQARTEFQNSKKVEELLKTKTYFEVRNCEGVNTETSEFAPSIFEDKLFFSTTRKQGVYEGNGAGFAAIYATKIEDWDNCRGTAKAYDEKIFAEGVNEASPTFAPDGSYMIFARSGSGKKNESNEVDLYIARKNADGTWSDPEILPYPININKSFADAGNDNLKGSKENAWTSCPFIRGDGKRLYFASNRKGGYGGVDLWQADINGARIINVRNLGREINTAGNELFPHVSDAGNLYFASDGHPGLGGLDMFEAVRKQGNTNIKNLGIPMNSSSDDFGMIFKTDTTGYFTSNREGGKGDDDIYAFKDITPDKKIIHYFLAINVVGIDPTDKDKKEIPLGSAKVNLFKGTELNKKEKLNAFTTNTQGKTGKTPIELRSNYVITADAGDDYFRKEIDYTTFGKSIDEEAVKEDPRVEIDTTFEAKVVLERIVIMDTITHPIEINFYFGDATIRPDAAKELDKFIIFLQENPQINVELGSHTDAVGSDINNQALSQRRADSTVAYLVEKGIDPTRLTAVGYGESRLKVKTQEANEENRRTEFKVTKIIRQRKRE